LKKKKKEKKKENDKTKFPAWISGREYVSRQGREVTVKLQLCDNVK
jgi:hypothetical protein